MNRTLLLKTIWLYIYRMKTGEIIGIAGGATVVGAIVGLFIGNKIIAIDFLSIRTINLK